MGFTSAERPREYEPIEKVIFSASADQVETDLKELLHVNGPDAYHGSLTEFRNRGRVAALLATAGGKLHLEWAKEKGKIAFASAEFPSQLLDFPILKQIVDLIISHNDTDDAAFAPVIQDTKELFAQTTLAKGLITSLKSGGSTTVFDHMMDYMSRVRTDGLPPKQRLALRLSFLHDLAKYIFRGPILWMENNQVVELSDPELVSLIKDDPLDDHGLVAALYFSQLWRYILESQTAQERTQGVYELFDEELLYFVTRLFRLHQLAAQMDRFKMTPEQVDELFGPDNTLKKEVLFLVTAMTAFDSASVAASSGDPRHARFSALNPMLVFGAYLHGEAEPTQEAQAGVPTMQADDVPFDMQDFLFTLISNSIEGAILMLHEGNEIARDLLKQLKVILEQRSTTYPSALVRTLAATS